MTALLSVLGVAAVLGIGVGFLFYVDRRQQDRVRELGRTKS